MDVPELEEFRDRVQKRLADEYAAEDIPEVCLPFLAIQCLVYFINSAWGVLLYVLVQHGCLECPPRRGGGECVYEMRARFTVSALVLRC